MSKLKSKTVFSCQNCGAQFPKWQGKCNDCGKWNTLAEEFISKTEDSRGWSLGSDDKAGPISVKLNETVVENCSIRTPTGFAEVDRVLGGGLVAGSYVLLGGDPGIGKSTLLLQLAGGLAKSGLNVLYVSAEESVQQTALRAQRLGVKNEKVEVGSESNLEQILNLTKSKKPNVLIVDSIQTIYNPQISSAPGSVSQVRECAGALMVVAKELGISVFLIGHVTKDGNIAGPKTLEHMVDTVLSFEGDSSQQFRLLRTLKNRFGSSHQLGVFQMDSTGLVEVNNPSELFLAERGDSLVGSVVFASLEGTRPLLCEVQALTSPSPMAMPRRTALGFDAQRVHLMVAVLDKHAGLHLSQRDVFVNVVGGLRIEEPAADLAVTAALLSSELEQSIDPHTVFMGEVGLTGEIRAITQLEVRMNEAIKLGFRTFVLPLSNKKHLTDDLKKQKVNFIWVKELRDLLQIFDLNKTRKRSVKKFAHADSSTHSSDLEF